MGVGIFPATSALTAPIELVTGTQGHFLGEPNPMMMHNSRNMLGRICKEIAIIGDSMVTDIMAWLKRIWIPS